MSRKAFTLVELLVVIAIIGILIGLLLPAINAAREAGRRAACTNNLKQLSLGVLNYTEAMGRFPPSCTWVNDDPSQPQNGKDNWVIIILPFMEYDSLYKQFNHDKPICDASNAVGRARKLKEMLCPSDNYNAKEFMGSSNSKTSAMNDHWARGNYGANGALSFMSKTRKSDTGKPPMFPKLPDGTNDPNWVTDPNCGGATTDGWNSPTFRGIMGSGCALQSKDVTDGLSHTFLLGELRAGITPFDCRGVWAMSGACPSSIWGAGSFCGDDWGPNSLMIYADDVNACAEIQAAAGSAQLLVSMWMPCSNGDWPNFQQTMRSTHSGGVNASMGDGSVQFISDLIECSPQPNNARTVWDNLITSGDGITIPSKAF